MTLALVAILSFAAGAACHWAATRNAVRQPKSDVLERLHERDVAESDLAHAIRLGEGAL